MLSIALRMLIGDKGKYLGVVLGLDMATFLMTQQPAIFLGILSRSYGILSDAGLADIWVMDPKVQFIDDVKPLLIYERVVLRKPRLQTYVPA